MPHCYYWLLTSEKYYYQLYGEIILKPFWTYTEVRIYKGSFVKAHDSETQRQKDAFCIINVTASAWTEAIWMGIALK